MEPRRYLWGLAFLLPLASPVLALLFLIGWSSTYIAVLPAFYVFIALPLLDALVGPDKVNIASDSFEDIEADPYYHLLMVMVIPTYVLSVLAATLLATKAGFALWEWALFTFGASFINATVIIAAHELGHVAKTALQRAAVTMSLGIVCYSHFTLEHNQGHHSNVATPKDPASSRYDESLYAFAYREMTGVFREGLRREALRLDVKGHGFWSVHNKVLQGWVISLAFAALLVVLFGWMALPFYVAHNLVVWFAVSATNYIEHYGILRARRGDKFEPVQAHHSWNSNFRITNLMFFHFQRHCDHHLNPKRPFPLLQNYESAPQLPSGYPGCYLLAFIPALWRRVMNKRFADYFGPEPVHRHTVDARG